MRAGVFLGAVCSEAMVGRASRRRGRTAVFNGKGAIDAQLADSMRQTGNPGYVLLSYGFRPFFLAAAAWAMVDIILWMSLFEHGGNLPSRFDPLSWHIHEMLFGFIMAAIAGFLLTAVANWTGRPPIRGWLLGLLVTAWVVGRLACMFSLAMNPWLVIILDLALPVLLVLLVAREIVQARNWRNLVMVAPVTVLAIANLLMHLESIGANVAPGLGWRLGIASVLVLVSAVAGRIVPAFTRNWLRKRGAEGPAPHGVVDRLALGGLHVALFVWVFLPADTVSGILLLMGSLLNAGRLFRWQGQKTQDEPLLLILHIGYAWLVIGVALLGVSTFAGPVPLSAALHSLTVGAMGTMIVAIMTRVTRGHTGRPLTAAGVTQVLFAAIQAATVTRVLAGFEIWTNGLLTLSAICWILAFVGFVVIYGPMLARKRVAME